MNLKNKKRRIKMKKIKESVEKLFLTGGKYVIRYRWIVVAFFLVVLGAVFSQIRHIQFDTSTEGFFHEESEEIKNYDAFREQFGRDEMLIVLLKPKKLFDLQFLKKLKALHEELEENVPSLNDINSLANARYTHGSAGQLLVEDLLEAFPETEADLKALRKKVDEHRLYKNLIVSEDLKCTTISIKTEAYSAYDANGIKIETDNMGFGGFEDSGMEASGEKILLTDEENSEIVHTVLEITDRYKSDDLEIFVGGSPIVTDYLKRSMKKDMSRFTLIAVISIAIFLFILFRRFTGTLLPLLCVIFSVGCSVGLMAILGIAVKTPTSILPSFLLAVGIGASIHLMAIFYNEFNGTNKTDAILNALSHSGLPIAMTGLTTAVGLASFSHAKLAPIADLGFVAAIGVMISLTLTLVLLPALMAIMPLRPGPQKKGSEKLPGLNHVLKACGHVATRYPKMVLGISGVIGLIAILGLFQLRIYHNNLEWFSKSSSIYQQTKMIDKEMKGSVTFEILVDTQKENGLYDPKILNGLKELGNIAQNDTSVVVGKALSLVDTLQEIHQALNENNPDFYRVPDNEQLIAQEFLLFENSGSDDLEDLVDSQFQKARFTAKVPWDDANTYSRFIEKMKQSTRKILGDDVKITATGLAVLFFQTVEAMIHSMSLSYLIAGGLISLMMIMVLSSVRLGLLSMIPNVLPIIVTLGIMGWINMPLDMFTLLIGSIAIGLAVDDTIHFFHNFQRYFQRTGSSEKAVDETLMSTGRAMLVTTLVLTIGFWTFMFSTMNNLFNFGLLCGLTLLLAFVADVLIAPALLTLIYGDQPVYRSEKGGIKDQKQQPVKRMES
jgi:predicted RND superfamily exporter protein